MSTKREAIKLEKRLREARQKTVRNITIGLVVLVVAAIIWIGLLKVTGYMSVASLTAAVV